MSAEKNILTIGFGGGIIVPMFGVPVPLGAAFSFDKVYGDDGNSDWFFTLGFGVSTPGFSFSIDRGKTKQTTKDSFMGKSVSINADMVPVGVEIVSYCQMLWVEYPSKPLLSDG